MVKINYSLCTGCGLCAKICPFSVFKMEADVPQINSETVGGCFKCMHCTAICPVAAVSFDENPKEVPNLPCAYSDMSYASAKDLVLSRRSIRHFSNKPVPLDELRDILRTADYAPSAKNQHPNTWILIHDTQKVREIMDLILDAIRVSGLPKEVLSQYEIGKDIVTLHAPHLLYGVAPKEGFINPYTDTTIALSTVDLLFHSKGIGACWGGYLARLTNANPKIRSLIGLSDDFEVFGALAFGYPEGESYERLPYRKASEISVI